MTTEHGFVTSHHSFWRELLPMGERYVRATNLGLARFCEPATSTSRTHVRGVVNELAFRLFARSVRESINLSTLSTAAQHDELAASVEFIRTFRQHGRGSLVVPSESEMEEAIQIAKQTAKFFSRSSNQPLLTRPRLPGCGWISACEADVLSGDVLYEIKSGARAFRLQDIKQVLVYCALNFAAKMHDIARICLVNPRAGVYFSDSLDSLCVALSGRSFVLVLSDIVEYVSRDAFRAID